MKRSLFLPLLVLSLAACVKRPVVVEQPKVAAVHQSSTRFASAAVLPPAKTGARSDAQWGEDFFRKGDYKRSIAYLSEAIKRDQGSSRLWRNLGSSYAMADDFDNAILCFERALKRNPADIKSLYNLSLVHSWKGTLEDAEDAAKRGLKLEPKHAGLHSSLGNIYADEQKEEEALQEYNTALQLNPKDPVTRFNLGGLHFKRRELKEAEKAYVKVLELAPKDVEAAQNLAAVYILQDRMADAEKLNKWVVKQKPKDEDTLENAYFNLGLIYDKQNKLEQALNMYKLALQVAPWDAAAYVNAAVILERLKRISEALAFWEKYQRLFPASRRATEISKRVEILKKMLKLEEPASKPKNSKKGASKA
jgi:superkiller protein 3